MSALTTQHDVQTSGTRALEPRRKTGWLESNSPLPRPQASLLDRARCALGYGIDSCGSQGVVGSMQTKSPAVLPAHHPSRSLFSRHTAFDRKAPGDEAEFSRYL